MREVTISNSAGFLCQVKVADNLWTRGWGLLGQKQMGEDGGLWIRPCKSVHTLFMGFPIDLVYLSADGTVVKTCPRVHPFQCSLGGRRAHSVLELPAGFLERKPITVGEKLVVGPAGYSTGKPSAERLAEAKDTPDPVTLEQPRRSRRRLGRRAGRSSAGETQSDPNRSKKNRPRGERFSISLGGVDDSKFPEVEALFTVDQYGRAASNIDPSQLKIHESGAPASLSSLQRVVDNDMPLGLVIAINIGWLTDRESLNKARVFARNLIDKLGPNDIAAVLAFGEESTIQQAFTADKAKLKQAVTHLGPGRKTALPDVVAEVARFAQESEPRRLAVVLVTDSCEFLSRSKLSGEKSLKIAHNSGCPFFVATVGRETDPTQDGHIYLTGLTYPSGGQLLEDVMASQAGEVFSSLEELLRSNYLVTFRTSSLSNRQDRSLKLSLGKGAASGSTKVNYVTQRRADTRDAFLDGNPGLKGQVYFQVLFPSPQFVVPLAFPLIMVGVGIGLGVKGTWQLVKLTLGGTNGAGKRLFGRRARRVVPVLPSEASQEQPASSRRRLRNNSQADNADVGGFASQATVLVTSQQAKDRRYEVVDKPVTIGSGAHCDIRLPAAPGVFPEHARLWWRDGRLMLHHLAPSQVTIVSGRHIIWTALQDGDEAAIGPYLLHIALQRDEFQPGAGLGPAKNSPQDVYAGISLFRSS